MLGLKKGTVNLSSHNEQWHQLFSEEKARIKETIRKHIIEIEHIGSTSICGISAKPILDMAVSIKKYSDGVNCVKPLENLGYEYRSENGISGRFYFVKGEPRTHHLHMVEVNSDFWKSHLLFRDYLRKNPAIAKEYDNLKRSLAKKNAENRDAYFEGKANFIENVLREAGFVKENNKKHLFA